MPTYQYACTACDERLEVVQKFSDDALTECTECGGRLRKVFSPVGIVFKGSGFYRTDSRNGSINGGSAKPKETTESSAEKKPTSDSGSSADTKPATKTESAKDSSPGKSSSTGTKVA